MLFLSGLFCTRGLKIHWTPFCKELCSYSLIMMGLQSHGIRICLKLKFVMNVLGLTENL